MAREFVRAHKKKMPPPVITAASPRTTGPERRADLGDDQAMQNNETHRPNDPTDSNALVLRAAQNGSSRGPKVLFIAASALGVAALPGVADQVLGALGSALVGTAHAGEPNQCSPEISQGYEENVILHLQKLGVELPPEVEQYISLFDLSSEYGGTIVRDRDIAILVAENGTVLQAPQGYYVFPDGVVAQIGKHGRIDKRWLDDIAQVGKFWAMCQPEPGVWVEC